MGDENPLATAPAPAVTSNRKSGAQLALALTVFALVLASNSIINQSWLVSADTDLGLMGSEDASYAELHDLCKSVFANETNQSEICAASSDSHNAGFIATIMLIVGAILLFAATVMQVRSMIGSNSRPANILSGIAGIWVGLSVLVWYLLMPETETDPDWGQGLWMALISATSAFIAGRSGKIQSWIDGPPRMRAHGVRSGTGMSEFVLKESSCGDHALSILVDSDLVRVVRVHRVGASSSIKDVLATRRDSYTGFAHQRIDWLDDFKGLWWVLCGASLICSFTISTLFFIPFTITSLLALLQLMDPERFVVSTNSGNHPFYINRWRSNRELTNLAMDLVDDAMIAVLRGEELDTEMLDARADSIAERFSADRDAKQSQEQSQAAAKEAFVAAANPPIQQQPTNPPTGPPVSNPMPMQQPPIVEQSQQPQQPTPPDWQEPVAEEVSEPEPAPAPAPAPEPEPAPEPVPAPESTPPVNPPAGPPSARPTSAPVTIPQPPAGPPSARPTSAPATIPPPPLGPPSARPTSAPVTIPPPPALPAMPPPPMGAAILPPMANPVPSAPPPPVVVQGAPREENLSDDEKDNLLGDLSS